MNGTNEVGVNPLCENVNFFIVNVPDMYLLTVGDEKYFVYLTEDEITLKNSKEELVKGYKSTLYNIMDNSTLFTRESEFSLVDIVIRSKGDVSVNVLGKKASLSKVITPFQKKVWDKFAENDATQEMLNKVCTSNDIDLSNAYFLEIDTYETVTKYLVRAVEYFRGDSFSQYYEYQFYNLCDHSLVATVERKSRISNGTHKLRVQPKDMRCYYPAHIEKLHPLF